MNRRVLPCEPAHTAPPIQPLLTVPAVLVVAGIERQAWKNVNACAGPPESALTGEFGLNARVQTQQEQVGGGVNVHAGGGARGEAPHFDSGFGLEHPAEGVVAF